jgi:predicted transcriptional regulator
MTTTDKELEKEVLTRLLHAHPQGLGKEILDNYRGETAVFEALDALQQRGLIQHGHVAAKPGGAPTVNYPIKLSAAGVNAAQAA